MTGNRLRVIFREGLFSRITNPFDLNRPIQLGTLAPHINLEN